jgi:hypothetical protein
MAKIRLGEGEVCFRFMLTSDVEGACNWDGVFELGGVLTVA